MEEYVSVVGNEQVEDVLELFLLVLGVCVEVSEDVRLDVLNDLLLVIAGAVVLDEVQELGLVPDYDRLLGNFCILVEELVDQVH